ncbi:MAG TPA: glucose 1-dehydrogenase [Clostridia bacterium]|nr:glucose 1-dehydrogenase [Clostridia bacterium]
MNIPSMSLKDKVAIVTGSTKGIGKGIAFGLAQAGANVVVVSRHQNDCDRVAAEIAQLGVETLPVAADVTKMKDIENLVNSTLARFGRIDILVNNAGTALTKKAEEITEEDWDRVLDVDLKGVFFCAQAVGKQMIKQKRGKIINIGSILGTVADRQVLPYCVSKGGVAQMTKALALEWAKYNIQVNSLCPGYVITPMNEADLRNEKIASHILRKIPVRRLGEVEDMVGAAIFLASEASNYMTGQSIFVDGGWTAE